MEGALAGPLKECGEADLRSKEENEKLELTVGGTSCYENLLRAKCTGTGSCWEGVKLLCFSLSLS